MKKIPLQLLTLAVLLTAAGLGLAESNDTATLNQIAGYRQWTRVTTQPLEVKPLTISADARVVGLPSPGDWIGAVFLDRSVVYVPQFLHLRNLNELPVITTSQGTTRIVFPSGVARDDKPKTPKPEAKHSSTFGVVYANAIAQTSMLSKVPTTFPVGSVIVREKLASPDATTPELLAVMIKRAQGFSRKAGDWEYLLISGNGQKIVRREKKDECRRCHAGQANRDFVFPEPPQ